MLDEITLSFVSSRRPGAMLKMLADRGLKIKKGAAPGIHAIEGAGFTVQIITLNELADPKTSYMFAVFLTSKRKTGAALAMLTKHLEDPANQDLKQLADFLLENELIEPVVTEEVLNMAQRMPAKKREQLLALFNKHPVSREWGRKLRLKVSWRKPGRPSLITWTAALSSHPPVRLEPWRALPISNF